MGGIVIDIWEKSNFLGSFGSQKGAKNAIFVWGGFKTPPSYGRLKYIIYQMEMVFKTSFRRQEKKPTLIKKSESSDVISSLLQLQVDHILVKV